MAHGDEGSSSHATCPNSGASEGTGRVPSVAPLCTESVLGVKTSDNLSQHCLLARGVHPSDDRDPAPGRVARRRDAHAT